MKILAKMPTKTIIITEEQLKEAMLPEFSFDKLETLYNFKDRLQYCRQYLGNPIGSGSSRVIFQLDDEKCLKLAKNNKGIAQNEAEAIDGADRYSIGTEVFKYPGNFFYIVSEYVLPAKESDFQHCLGISFKEFQNFVIQSYKYYASRKETYYLYGGMDDEQFSELLEENDWLSQLYNYMSDYHLPYGDLTRLSSYGICRRDGDTEIVVLDSGFNDTTSKLYRRY